MQVSTDIRHASTNFYSSLTLVSNSARFFTMVTIKFFAMLKGKVGRDEVEISIPGQIALNQLKEILKREFPSIKDYIDKSIMISVNQEFAASDTIIKDGDEVALLPPFSGG